MTGQAQCSINTMEYDSTFKNKITLTHAIMWMKLQVIIPSETRLTQKENCSMIPLVWDIHIRQIPSRIRWPGVECGWVFNGYSVTSGKEKYSGDEWWGNF